MAKSSPGHLAAFWCMVMHRASLWPSHGRYRCSTCLREYPVPWELEGNRSSSQQHYSTVLAGAPRLDETGIPRATPVAHLPR